MKTDKLQDGQKFYHSDLNNLICCRDKFYNLCYGEEEYLKHKESDLRYYTVDNSGAFHTSSFKKSNSWKEFIVIDSRYDGGSSGYDAYPDAWVVICKPINEPHIRIRFHQQTNCFAHTINEVELL